MRVFKAEEYTKPSKSTVKPARKNTLEQHIPKSSRGIHVLVEKKTEAASKNLSHRTIRMKLARFHPTDHIQLQVTTIPQTKKRYLISRAGSVTKPEADGQEDPFLLGGAGGIVPR